MYSRTTRNQRMNVAIKKCTSAAVLQCSSAPVQQSTSPAVHQCSSAPVQQCSSGTTTAMQQWHHYSNATVHQCSSAVVHQYSSAVVHQYSSAAVQQCSSRAVRYCSSAALHQYSSAAVRHCSSAPPQGLPSSASLFRPGTYVDEGRKQRPRQPWPHSSQDIEPFKCDRCWQCNALCSTVTLPYYQWKYKYVSEAVMRGQNNFDLSCITDAEMSHPCTSCVKTLPSLINDTFWTLTYINNTLARV